MMSKRDVQESLNRALCSIREDPYLTQKIIQYSKAASRPRKRKPVMLIIGLSVMILAVSAMATGMITRHSPAGLATWIFSDKTKQADNPEPIKQVVFPLDESDNYYINSHPENNDYSKDSFKSKPVEFSEATISIREILFDRYGIYMTIAAIPSDSHVLLLDYSMNPFENTPEDIGCESDYDQQTIAKWAVEHGYQGIMRVSFSSPAPEPYTSGRLVSSVSYDPESNDRHIVQIDTFQNDRISAGSNFDSYHDRKMQLEDDGTVSIMLSGAYTGQETYQIACTMFPWRMTPEGEKDPVIRDIPGRDPDDALYDYDYSEHQVITFTLPALQENDTVLLAEYEGNVAVKNSPDDTAPVTVKLIRTMVNDYCEVTSKDTNRVFDGISVFLDEEETEKLKPGRFFISSYQMNDNAIVFIQSCDAPEEIPLRMYLRWDDYGLNLSQTATVEKMDR